MYVDYKILGKRIANRRRELGLKQREVNELADLSDKYLSNIERATSVLSVDVLMKLCDVLKTTPNALLLGAADTDSNTETQKATAYLSSMSMEKQLFALSFLEWLSSKEV